MKPCKIIFILSHLFLFGCASSSKAGRNDQDVQTGQDIQSDSKGAALSPVRTFVKISKTDLPNELLDSPLMLTFDAGREINEDNQEINWTYPLKHLLQHPDEVHWLAGMGIPVGNGKRIVKRKIKIEASLGEDEAKRIIGKTETEFEFLPLPNGRLMVLVTLTSKDKNTIEIGVEVKIVGVGDPLYPNAEPGLPSNDTGIIPEAEPMPGMITKKPP